LQKEENNIALESFEQVEEVCVERQRLAERACSVEAEAADALATTPEIRPVEFERSRRDDRELLFTANRSEQVRNEAVFVREVQGFDAAEPRPLHLPCAYAPVGDR
jgi:hypothetical protein